MRDSLAHFSVTFGSEYFKRAPALDSYRYDTMDLSQVVTGDLAVR